MSAGKQKFKLQNLQKRKKKKIFIGKKIPTGKLPFC